MDDRDLFSTASDRIRDMLAKKTQAVPPQKRLHLATLKGHRQRIAEADVVVVKGVVVKDRYGVVGPRR